MRTFRNHTSAYLIVTYIIVTWHSKTDGSAEVAAGAADFGAEADPGGRRWGRRRVGARIRRGKGRPSARGAGPGAAVPQPPLTTASAGIGTDPPSSSACHIPGYHEVRASSS